MEVTHNIQSVVLDKTGTITQGKPVVTDIYGVKTDSTELLKIAAAMEKKSEHPLAEAVLAKAAEEDISLPEASEFSAVAGMGIEAVIEGKKYYAGNLRLMKEKNISCAGIEDYLETLTGEGKTPLLFAAEKELLGVIGAADVVKPTSAQAIRELKKNGDSGYHAYRRQ